MGPTPGKGHMAEPSTPPSGPLAGASGRELRGLQQFLLYLGSALTAAGEAVNQIEERLRRVAATTILLAGRGLAEADLRAMIAPLVTEYLGQEPLAGVQDFLGAVGSMVAIALGVLCGYPLYRSLAGSLGWLQDLGSD